MRKKLLTNSCRKYKRNIDSLFIIIANGKISI